MASTTTNGVVHQTPYGVVRGVDRARPFTLSVIGPDPLRGGVSALREFPALWSRTLDGFFVYVGDKITFTLQAPCLDPAAKAFDLVAHNPTTGVDSAAVPVNFNAAWQRQIVVNVTGFNGLTGAFLYTITRS